MSIVFHHVIFRALLRWGAALVFCLPLRHRTHFWARACGMLFPLFLLESALQYSMIGWIRRHPDIQKWICVLPAATLAVYFPPVFRFIVNQWPVMHSVLVEGSYWWITAYVAVALVLMIQELFAITMRFCRKQFVGIVGCHLALSGLYLLYCGQDPAQV